MKRFTLLVWLLLCLLPVFSVQALQTEDFTLERRTLTFRDDITHLGFSEDEENDARFYGLEGIPFKLSHVHLPAALQSAGGQSFTSCAFGTLVFPEGFQFFDDYAFIYCDIDRLALPSTLLGLSFNHFELCGIGAFDISPDHPRLKTVDGVLYTKDMKTLLMYPNRKKDAHFTVPQGVEHIQAYAFIDNSFLAGVSLPLGLKTIGEGAFGSCGRLAAVSVPLTVENVEDYAFANCVSLSRVSLPPHARLGKDVFDNCPPLKESLPFEGDNGGTASAENSDPRNSVWERMYLLTDKPDTPIPLYTTPDENSPLLGTAAGGWNVCCRKNEQWLAIRQNFNSHATQEQEAYLRAEYLAAASMETLFHLTLAQPRGADIPLYQELHRDMTGAPADRPGDFLDVYGFPQLYGGYVLLTCWQPSYQEGGFYGFDWRERFASLPDCVLQREHTGDSRALGLVTQKTALYKAAGQGGPALAVLAPGTQAEKLEETDGFVKLRGDFEEGYVDARDFMLVEQEKED